MKLKFKFKAKVLVYIIFLIMFLTFRANSQNDYVVGLRNDTIYGQIESFDDKIIFVKHNNRELHLVPSQINCYFINGEKYVSCFATSIDFFARMVIDDFPISVVAQKYTITKKIITDGYSDIGFDESVYERFYYWNKSTNRYCYIKTIGFRRQAMRYFRDDEDLCNEIKFHHWTIDSLSLIVEKYNRMKCKQK